MWELLACVEGYGEAHGGEPPLEPPTDEEFDEMIAASKAWEERRKRAKLEAQKKDSPTNGAGSTPSD